MDFNTGGRSGSPDDLSRRPVGGSTGGPGGEFDLSDPIGSFVATVRRVLTQPAAFFSGMVRQGDFVNPAVFALICYTIFALLSGLVGLVFGNVLGVLRNQQDATGVAGSIGGFLIAVILAPFVAAIILLVVAAVRHLLVMLIVGNGNAGFEATLRVSAYTFATRLVWWVPIVGPIVGFFYGLFLSVVGIRETHTTTTGKAALIVLIPAVVALVFLLTAAALIGAAVFTLLQQQT